jgi:hypothetical protein
MNHYFKSFNKFFWCHNFLPNVTGNLAGFSENVSNKAEIKVYRPMRQPQFIPAQVDPMVRRSSLEPSNRDRRKHIESDKIIKGKVCL